MLPSGSQATAAATGTSVLPSAAITVYSRTTSCAEDVSPDNGGRRATQLDCSSLTLNVKLDLPPDNAVTTSWPCTLTPLSIRRRRKRRVSRAGVFNVHPRSRYGRLALPTPNDVPPRGRRRCETAGLRVISGPPASRRTLPARRTSARYGRRRG